MQKFSTVLVANRGEIAVRVMRTVHALGLRAVAIYSDADRKAPHVLAADQAVHVGPAAASQSYLDIDKVIAAARASGAEAIHPGYGFLSENAAFARRCEEEGIVFIGPPAAAIDKMGDKITARATVESRGVPTVPGISRPGLTDEEIIAAAPEIGFPVLIKPSAGGGGKGMHRVEDAKDLPQALVSARREAASSFGDDALFMEHFVDTPRHIEVQVVADSHGNVIHLGERECSLQRRHQKVIEEAPSVLLDEKTRAEIGEAACDAARSCGYRGAGTVEFIVSAKQPERFFFMEMNTRLQVEHPVTELVTGVDLVEWQIRVAMGEQLPLAQEDIHLGGHAVEARVYAEDAAAGFLPTGGTIESISWPEGPGVRVDSGVRAGQHIGSDYDPMLAKIITWAPDRGQALQRLDAALGRTIVDGVTTNVNFNRFLVTRPEVVAGDIHTGLLDNICQEFAEPSTPASAFGLVALHRAISSGARAAGVGRAWSAGDAWRGGRQPGPIRMLLTDNGTDPHGTVEVQLQEKHQASDQWLVDVNTFVPPGAEKEAETRHQQFTLELLSRDGDDFQVSIDGAPAQHWRFAPPRRAGAELSHVTGGGGTYSVALMSRSAAVAEAVGSGAISSPMPGTVIAVEVADGDQVEQGQAVLVIEAMKMEHTLSAQLAGTVAVQVSVGDKVATGDVLAEVL